jgi:hypothetical protein
MRILLPGEVRGRRVQCYSELEKDGDFYFEFDENKKPISFTFAIPDKKGGNCKIYFLPGGWQIEGSLNTPSIVPSVWIDAKNNGWHGTITDGVFRRV